MAKLLNLLFFCAFLNISIQEDGVNSNTDFICENKCECEENTDEYEQIPLVHVDCSRLDMQGTPKDHTLPSFIGRLDLSHNKITTLKESSQLSSNTLYYFDLSYNEVDVISVSFFKNLTKLVYLNLGHNKLKSIDKNWFIGLVNLKKLNLQSNKFKTLPASSFVELTGLQELNLNHNILGDFLQEKKLIEYIPNSILKLHLDNIRLKNISRNMFEDIEKIKALSVAYNPFSDLPYIPLGKLEYLDISGTKISNITTKSLMFPNLKILKMNRLNELTIINDYTFFNLHKLEELYIEHCYKLQEMKPITFGYLLDKNSPNHLPLKKFSVAYSGLKSLPDTFEFIFQDLNEIHLRGNNWDCSCKLSWFLRLRKNVKDIDDIRCSSPTSQANKIIHSLTDEELSCFTKKKISLPPGAPTQNWLYPVIGVLAIIILILIGILIYMGPYGQNIYKTEGKMIGPDSPYSPISIYPNHAENIKV